ncbi:restriction endonuclease subunit S [Mycoplasmopsis felis]|uniref:restriction endonuclease subunit S n=1 Tax=Mycoplasmopsis felis TaxID=33923 RepID=UPI002AFDEB79|nr:restriction endonuclease subunit S [Mycoplasmopsis felis]WQQ07965.1 restriction endonuclease subunit S [Mycoplasmopsis felis]
MKKVLVPRVRFKGFDEEWKKDTIRNIANITNGKLDANAMVKSGMYNFYTSGIDVYKIDKYSFEGEGISIAGNGVNMGYMHLVSGKYNAYQRTYILNNIKIDRHFLFYNLWKNFWEFCQKNTREGSIPYLLYNDISDFKIFKSHSNEQQKIGKLLENIDNLISLEQSKLNKLKQLKQTLLQKMFPEHNSKKPRIRFKGFSEEWKEDTIGNIATITNGKSNTSDNNKWGQYNLYIRSEEIYKSNKYIFDVEGVITVGDGNIGKIFHYVNGKFDLHQRCYLIYEFQNIWPKYFYYYFSQNFYKRAILMSYTATVNSIRINTITDMDIMFPKELIEQQKIGDFFCKIDTLINLHNSKLNKLKQLKAALLQKMFV